MTIQSEPTKVGDILKLEYGKPLDKQFRRAGAEFRAYGANGPKSPAEKFLVKGPVIIVGRKGSAGEITYVDENCWPLDVTYFVTHDERQSDLRYLFYLLKSLDIKQFVRGVKPGLNRNDVYGLPITLPSLGRQKEIARNLDVTLFEIDLLQVNLESQINKLQYLRESLYRDLARESAGL